MKTSSDFLDEVKAFYGLKSDYQLSRFLKLTDSRISFYRTGKSRFDEETCIQIAKVLNYQPGYVLACVSAERTKSDKARGEWERVAQLLGGIAAAVLLVSFALFLAPVAGQDSPTSGLYAMAGIAANESRTLYIMSNEIMAARPLYLGISAYTVFFLLSIACRPARCRADCENNHDNSGK